MLEELRAKYPNDANMVTFVITEVTHMNGKVCVAAYDIHAGRIIRPLSPNGDNWPEEKWYDTGFFRPGSVIRVEPFNAPLGHYPHATDDFPVQGTLHPLETLSEDDLHTLCYETADGSIFQVFGGLLQEGKYVPEGGECRSLGCILVPKANIHPSIPFDKIRVSITDSDGRSYSLAITEMATRGNADPAVGLATIQGRLEAYGNGYPVALRIGLTRPFIGFPPEVYNPKRCILQLNGIVGPD